MARLNRPTRAVRRKTRTQSARRAKCLARNRPHEFTRSVGRFGTRGGRRRRDAAKRAESASEAECIEYLRRRGVFIERQSVLYRDGIPKCFGRQIGAIDRTK